MFHYTGGDVDILSDDDTRFSQEAQSKLLSSPVILKHTKSRATTDNPAASGPFAPPASYTLLIFLPSPSQSTQKMSLDVPSLPTSGPTDASADLAAMYLTVKKSITDSLPSRDLSDVAASHGKDSADLLPQLHASSSTEPVTLSRSADMMAKHEWNLGSLDAVIVSASFLKNRINNLLWIKARLIKHQGHVLRCQTFAQRNLDAISCALYLDSKMGELRSSLSSSTDAAQC
ncbi:hypothetical protein EST38_g13135 [Candolleomyces aberdarensis]|uniref:Uncharacterized protein n=1 Tax=Candolleomyces aberdarensis TaxID=2316362 RepID=A0A4Q2D0L4_9AGAR|nr:hypothetical protein EST38_g13135 [Candolleomyces aberdarensis]